MSDLSTYLGDALLNWFKSTDLPSAPASVKVALFNGDPEASGAEVTGTVGLTQQTVAFGSVAARAISNSGEINFGNASGSASVDYVVLYDDSGTNILAKKAISAASIVSGEKVSIASAALSLTY